MHASYNGLRKNYLQPVKRKSISTNMLSEHILRLCYGNNLFIINQTYVYSHLSLQGYSGCCQATDKTIDIKTDKKLKSHLNKCHKKYEQATIFPTLSLSTEIIYNSFSILARNQKTQPAPCRKCSTAQNKRKIK